MSSFSSIPRLCHECIHFIKTNKYNIVIFNNWKQNITFIAFISVSFGMKFGNISTYSNCKACKSYEYTALQIDSVSSPIFLSVIAKFLARFVSIRVVPRRACILINFSIRSRSASESWARVLKSSSKCDMSTAARTDSSSRSLKIVPATCWAVMKKNVHLHVF